MSNKNWFVSFSLLAVVLTIFPITKDAALVAGTAAFFFMVAWGIEISEGKF